MKRKKRKRTKPRLFKHFAVKVFPYIYGKYCFSRYNVIVGKNEAADMDEPYILLSNHVTNFDGCFLQQIINKPIAYVINDKAFRVLALRVLLTRLDLIAKKKFSSDIKTVRDIYNAKARGEIICIFAEGRRCWDGVTADIVESTYTLIKSIKMPVLVANIKGGSASRPRWHDKKQNKGTVVIDIIRSLSSSDIKKMNTEQIKSKIKEDLFNDEYNFVAKSDYTYSSEKMAEGMERLVFVCPECQSISTLSSEGNIVYCNSCEYAAEFTEKYSFMNGKFESLAQWNNYQKDYLAKYIETLDEDEKIFEDVDITLYTARGYEKLRVIDHGAIYATKRGIVFDGEHRYEFPHKDIAGPSIQNNNAYEFDMDDVTYRLLFSNRDNAFKYQLLMKILNLEL